MLHVVSSGSGSAANLTAMIEESNYRRMIASASHLKTEGDLKIDRAGLNTRAMVTSPCVPVWASCYIDIRVLRILLTCR